MSGSFPVFVLLVDNSQFVLFHLEHVSLLKMPSAHVGATLVASFEVTSLSEEIFTEAPSSTSDAHL
jgi:hypothetical protein